MVFLYACIIPISAQTEYPPGEDGLRELLTHVMEANRSERRKITSALEPIERDFEKVFQGRFLVKAIARQHQIIRQGGYYFAPLRKEETRVHLWETTTEALLSYEGTALSFPGGYKELAPHLKPGLTLYYIKFTEPGAKYGSAFDMLIYVNGHWRYFPQPWLLLI
ncbi:MAG: hypothetical protein AAGI38_13870 [Bacteroidota bacterium]